MCREREGGHAREEEHLRGSGRQRPPAAPARCICCMWARRCGVVADVVLRRKADVVGGAKRLTERLAEVEPQRPPRDASRHCPRRARW